MICSRMFGSKGVAVRVAFGLWDGMEWNGWEGEGKGKGKCICVVPFFSFLHCRRKMDTWNEMK
jgi:hypothetical protein